MQQDWLEKDFYAILGVSKDAKASDIKKQYRSLARELHPDKNPGDAAAEERFKVVSEAYDVLSDASRRSEYDAIRDMAASRTAPTGPGEQPLWASAGFTGIDFDDLLRDLMGAGRYGRRGRDMETELRLSLTEALDGTHVEAPRPSGGTVRVAVPGGVRDGARLRVPGMGGPGVDGGPHGDLYVRVTVEPHEGFERVGRDVRVRVDVPFTTAALGGKQNVTTPRGRTVTLRIPAGTSSGRTLRVRGEGARPAAGKHGDMLVELRVTVPARLTGPQREVLEQLAASLQDGEEARS